MTDGRTDRINEIGDQAKSERISNAPKECVISIMYATILSVCVCVCVCVCVFVRVFCHHKGGGGRVVGVHIVRFCNVVSPKQKQKSYMF